VGDGRPKVMGLNSVQRHEVENANPATSVAPAHRNAAGMRHTAASLRVGPPTSGRRQGDNPAGGMIGAMGPTGEERARRRERG
jgi:hypothetical protein